MLIGRRSSYALVLVFRALIFSPIWTLCVVRNLDILGAGFNNEYLIGTVDHGNKNSTITR